MPPQKNVNKLERDIEEIKLTLNSITNNMSNLKELTEEIKGLKKLLSEKEIITTQLQQRVDNLERNSRKDNVIISRLGTTYHSYARVAIPSGAVGEDASSEELQSLEEQVTDFMEQQVVPADVHQQIEEESPEEWKSGVNQQHPELLPTKEELWISLEEEQLEVKEETDDIKSSFIEAPLKSEENEENHLFSHLHQQLMVDVDLPISSSADQIIAAAGGAETSRNPDLNTHDDDSSSAKVEDSDNDEEKLLFSQPHQHLVDADLPTSSSADQMIAAAGGAETSRNPDPNTHDDDSSSAKTEDGDNDEEKLLFSQPHQHLVDADLPTSSSADQMIAAAGGAETSRNPDLNTPDDDSSSSEMEVSEDDKDGSSSLRDPKNEDLKRDGTGSGVTVINKLFSCSECGRQFVNRWLLQKYPTCHLRIICSNCLVKNKRIERKTLVGSNWKVQKIQKPFSCDDCGKIYTRKEYLNNHRKKHTGHKSIGCDNCGQRFSDKSSFQSHMKIHSGQKWCVCKACGKRFSQKRNLNAHISSHTGQKPFACDVCRQRFSGKSNFRSHRRIHT